MHWEIVYFTMRKMFWQILFKTMEISSMFDFLFLILDESENEIFVCNCFYASLMQLVFRNQEMNDLIKLCEKYSKII